MMNQYDFRPIDNYYPLIARIVFAVLVVLFGLAWCCSGCKEVDPPLTMEEKLQGVWQRDYLDLTARYNFHQGACDVYVITPAQPVQYYAYAYAVNGDTLTMLELAGGVKDVFTVRFPTDTTAILDRIDGIEYFLLRVL